MVARNLIDSASRSASKKTRRSFWKQIHLWLGLCLGVPLVVFGITGSVLVFWQEIDAALNPALYRVAQAAPVPLEKSVNAAISVAPPGWTGIWLPLPADNQSSLPFHFGYPPSVASRLGIKSLNIFVDPGSGNVINTRVFYHAWNPLKHCLIGFFFKLHYAFFLGDFGLILVGSITVLLVISTLTGLILWWPLDGKWKRVLTLKKQASSVRFNHDLHQTTGFYMILILLAVLMSGISFNLSNQFRWIVERFSPLQEQPVSSTHAASPTYIDLDAAIKRAHEIHPGGTLDSLTMSDLKEGILTTCYRNVPKLSPYVLDTRCLTIDRQSGEVLQVQDPAHGSGGDVFMQWQWPLHSGTIFGWTGRILVFLCGLACPVIFITGVIRWIQKRRARRIAQERRSQPEPETNT